jgi:putative membrane protein
MTRKDLTSVVAAVVISVASGSIFGVARAQSGSTPPTTPQKSATAAHPAPATSTTFVHDLAMAGMAEIQLGQLASQRAANADVKAFGDMMIKDHTKAGDELKPIAGKLNITLPTSLDQKHQALYDRLSKLEGAAFDKEYVNAMAAGHQEVLAKVRARASMNAAHSTSNRTDSHTAAGASAQSSVPSGAATAPATADSQSADHELTMWASSVAPTVQQHLNRAKELQRQVAK